MKKLLYLILAVFLVCLFSNCCYALNSGAKLIVKGVKDTGLVTAHVDLGWFAKNSGIVLNDNEYLQLRASVSNKKVPAQFVPDSENGLIGNVVLKLPESGDYNVNLTLSKTAKPAVDISNISTKYFSLRFDPARQGGLPYEIKLNSSGKVLNTYNWEDRVYDKNYGIMNFSSNKDSKVEVVSDGDICTVVRVTGSLVGKDDKNSHPYASYDWYIYKNLPLVNVKETLRQKVSFSWQEVRFLQINFYQDSFKTYYGGEPFEQHDLTATTNQYWKGPGWGLLADGKDAIGIFGDQVGVYDGRGGYGTYIQADWTAFTEIKRDFNAWLYLNSCDSPKDDILYYSKNLLSPATAVCTTAKIQNAIKSGIKDLSKREIVKALEKQARFADAENIIDGKKLLGILQINSGYLSYMLDTGKNGISSLALIDNLHKVNLMSTQSVPLFDINLIDENLSNIQLNSSSGWNSVAKQKTSDGYRFTFSNPQNTKAAGISAVLTLTTDKKSGSYSWHIDVNNKTKDLTITQVTDGQISLREFADRCDILVPTMSGYLEKDALKRNGSLSGSSMQFFAQFSQSDRPFGFYFGMHDPRAESRNMAVYTDAASRTARYSDTVIVPNQVPGNSYVQSGADVWKALQGDWYDASQIYKTWVTKHASWYPKMDKNGRVGVPQRFKDLCAWVDLWSSGTLNRNIEETKEFKKLIGIPMGIHWYAWEKARFDTDYPHFLPATDGFTDRVKEMQQMGCLVMPYINGLIWDTHDRLKEDWQFTSLALPWTLRRIDGSYQKWEGISKDDDGSLVYLALMCSGTKFWQDYLAKDAVEVIKTLGVDGLYIDQISATANSACYAQNHQHKPGGGSWWAEDYAKMTKQIRNNISRETFLTSENNNEMFMDQFDGFLTWAWQRDNLVPAFPAVYAGAVMMFGRDYEPGKDTEKAFAMKCGQQLVFGEQIGWLQPYKYERNGVCWKFAAKAMNTRYRFRRYFYAGNMLRPPKLSPTPKITACWSFCSGDGPIVTTDSVLSGAWNLAAEHKAVYIFVNVSDSTVDTTFNFNAESYGIKSKSIKRTTVTDLGRPVIDKVSSKATMKLHMQPRQITTVELQY